MIGSKLRDTIGGQFRYRVESMTERPIKKSDRDAAKQADGATPEAQKRETPKPIKKGDRKEGEGQSNSQGRKDSRDGGGRGKKGKGRGKGRDKEASRAPVNPALVRGPRPSPKPEVPEISEEEANAEAAEGIAQAEAEGTETATAETTESSAEETLAEANTEGATEASDDQGA